MTEDQVHGARDPEDARLVTAFLEEVARRGLSQSESARLVEGITQSDVSRWARGVWTRLSKVKKRALMAFVSSLDRPENDDTTEHLGPRVATTVDQSIVEGAVTMELRRRASSREAFDAAEVTIREMHREDKLSDAALRYWEALCAGAYLFAGYRRSRPSDAGPSDAEPSYGGPSGAGLSGAGLSGAGPPDAGPPGAEPSDAGPSDSGPSDASGKSVSA